jgi:small subunit ribosomal protein S21
MIVVPLVEGENIEEAIKKFKRKFEKTNSVKKLRSRQTSSKDTVKKRKQYIRAKATSIDEKIISPEKTIEKSVIYSDNERDTARAAVMAKAVSSKKEALAFLKGAGILDKKGELAEPYK